MIGVIRLRGSIKIEKEINDTLRMLHLKRVNTLALLEDNAITRGMIRKVENFVTWGELSDELLKELELGSKKFIGLKPAKGGLRSIKTRYPKGDLGYRGTAINDLIKKMM